MPPDSYYKLCIAPYVVILVELTSCRYTRLQADVVLYDRYGAFSSMSADWVATDASLPQLPTIEEGVVISPILQAVHMAMAFPRGSGLLPLVDEALHSHILKDYTVFK
jgi:hypothetical protein